MRTVGALGISTGTSLAFESGVNNTLSKTDTLLVNLRTIVRNAIEAYEPDDPDGKDPVLITAAVREDLIGITKFITGLNLPKSTSFIVYNPSYKSLPKEFPHAKLWEPTTDKQKDHAALMGKVIKAVVDDFGTAIKQTDIMIPDFTGEGLIITSHPVDLALTKSYARLQLLESYTGLVRPHTMWYSKLTGGEKLFNMPLNKFTIQIFGDKSTNFRSESFKIKRLVEDIAQKAKWTSGSTIDRIRSSINSYSSGFDRTGLLNLL